MLLDDIAWVRVKNFDIGDTGLSQSLFFHGIPCGSITLIMPIPLIFDSSDRIAKRPDHKDIHSLAVDRVECLLIL